MTQRRAEGPHRVVQLALLTAIALTIFMAEAQLPPLVPIQGVKLGLANIVTVYAVFVLGPGDALLILSARVFLGAVFSGQMMTLLYSAGGGLLAWAVMAGLSRILTVKQLWLASPLAAVFHNLGQLLVAAGVFGVCFLVDRLFTRLFRSRAQHRSGMAVRAGKRYGAFGVILMVLGVAALIFGENLRVPGAAVLLMGGYYRRMRLLTHQP